MEQVQMGEQVQVMDMDIEKVNELNFLNEQVEEFTSR